MTAAGPGDGARPPPRARRRPPRRALRFAARRARGAALWRPAAAPRLHPPRPPARRRRSILYQRGIYPQDTFAQKKHYGLAMMVTKDDGLLAYLTNVGAQMTGARRLLCVRTAQGGAVIGGRSVCGCHGVRLTPLRFTRAPPPPVPPGEQTGSSAGCCSGWCWW